MLMAPARSLRAAMHRRQVASTRGRRLSVGVQPDRSRASSLAPLARVFPPLLFLCPPPSRHWMRIAAGAPTRTGGRSPACEQAVTTVDRRFPQGATHAGVETRVWVGREPCIDPCACICSRAFLPGTSLGASFKGGGLWHRPMDSQPPRAPPDPGFPRAQFSRVCHLDTACFCAVLQGGRPERPSLLFLKLP